ncbi:MAG: hypothetical protein ACI9NQ_000823 [Paracoccaceae bacterium]|jgi:hypothetical protein
MDTNLSKTDRLIREGSSSKFIRVNSWKFLVPLIVGFLTCLLHSPASAQQDGAPELSAEASRSIDKGLGYLLTIQKEDGSWDSNGEGGHAVAMTSLSLMAFMSKAHFPGFGQYGKQLDRGMKWLLKAAKGRPDGYLGTVMYEHGLATLALSEMWGMARDPEDDDAIQRALEKAVDVILRSQNPGGGWRYQPQADGGEDTSCTQTVFHALASARQAGIYVPNETIAKVAKYLESVQDPQTGGFAYNPRGGKVTTACTAGGIYTAQLAGLRDTEMASSALRHLKSLAPGIITGGGSYYYYTHYYAIQAMVQAGDDEYAKWYPQIRDALISRQNEKGAWDKGSGHGGGGYSTPMAIIILATPHRYIPIYQR